MNANIAHRQASRLAVTAACALALAPLSLSPAHAAVIHGHNSFDVIFPSPNLCGSGHDAVGHAVGSETDVVRLNKAGYPLFFSNFVGTTTFTAGARSVSVRFAGPSRDLSVVSNGDGTITVTTAYTGQISVLSSSSGGTDVTVGRVVYASLLYDNGTPGNADDDVFVSQTVVSQSGQISALPFCTALTNLLFG